MEEKKRISVLFDKYIAKDANQAEIKELLDLVKHTQADVDLDQDMQALWAAQDGTNTGDVDWQKMYSNITQEPAARMLYPNRRNWLRAVAAIFIGVVAAGIWQIKQEATVQDTVVYTTSKALPGKTLALYLNDGTKVTLNSGSEIRYPKTFAAKKREVYLDGEAFFEVAHNPSKSFLVHSGGMVTSVLGTSFNITAYAGLSNMSVTVHSGKVAVKNTASAQLVTLTPKQRAVLRSGTAEFAVDSVKDLSETIAWEKGELIFNNATLEEIALKVGYRYGIQVEVTNTKKSQRKITGTFNRQSFLEIMTAITHLTETSYKGEGKNYTIY